jgi:ribonuclease BN (tRNA processing enzyme)
MRLVVVGSAGSFPGPDSAASCYLVQAEGPDGAGTSRTWNVLLDLGNGALGPLQRHTFTFLEFRACNDEFAAIKFGLSLF